MPSTKQTNEQPKRREPTDKEWGRLREQLRNLRELQGKTPNMRLLEKTSPKEPATTSEKPAAE